jgi:hypothetical protein
MERAAAWLFRITAQSPPDIMDAGLSAAAEKMLEPVRQAGFHIRMEHRLMPGSTVLVVIAEKPGTPPLE